MPGSDKLVAIVDRKLDEKQTVAETWLYDLGEDSWSQIAIATLPLACGMNYNLEYDSRRDPLLLVTGGYRQPTAVWALRVTPERQP